MLWLCAGCDWPPNSSLHAGEVPLKIRSTGIGEGATEYPCQGCHLRGQVGDAGCWVACALVPELPLKSWCGLTSETGKWLSTGLTSEGHHARARKKSSSIRKECCCAGSYVPRLHAGLKSFPWLNGLIYSTAARAHRLASPKRSSVLRPTAKRGGVAERPKAPV